MEAKQDEPVILLRTVEEKQLWIQVYARNSDNEDARAVELAKWADFAVLEMRKRI